MTTWKHRLMVRTLRLLAREIVSELEVRLMRAESPDEALHIRDRIKAVRAAEQEIAYG